MIYLLLFPLLASILIATYLLRLEIGLFFSLDNEEIQGEIFVGLAHLFRKRVPVPAMEGSIDGKEPGDNRDDEPRSAKLATLGSDLLSRLNMLVKKLAIEIRLGLDDPALTGIGVGLIWAIIASTPLLLQKFFNTVTYAQRPEYKIIPVYNQFHLEARVRCIVSFRLGEIIVEGLKILLMVFLRRYTRWMNTTRSRVWSRRP